MEAAFREQNLPGWSAPCEKLLVTERGREEMWLITSMSRKMMMFRNRNHGREATMAKKQQVLLRAVKETKKERDSGEREVMGAEGRRATVPDITSWTDHHGLWVLLNLVGHGKKGHGILHSVCIHVEVTQGC